MKFFPFVFELEFSDGVGVELGKCDSVTKTNAFIASFDLILFQNLCFKSTNKVTPHKFMIYHHKKVTFQWSEFY